MLTRLALLALIVAIAALVPSFSSPAQAQGNRKVIQVSLVSFAFTPSLITVTQGDTVVLQLSNDDPDKRNHSFAARWLVDRQVTVRGEITREGVAEERRFFALAPGQKAEIEFVMNDRGSFPFVCGVFDHAGRGQTGAINVLAP